MIRHALPRGGALPGDLWEGRHRMVMVVLWLHVVAVPLFGAVVGRSWLHVALDTAPIALLGASASLQSASSQRVRSLLASVGLLAASAVVVHLAGGATEAHFHFFVMIALIALYQDWTTLLAAIGFVGVHHAAVSLSNPEVGLARSPLAWTAVHAGFVLAASAVHITSWRVTEVQHERSEEALRANERWFRALIEHSKDGLSVIGPDRNVRYDSPSVRREFGLPDRVGQAGLLGMHPDDLEWIRSVIASLRPGGSAVVEHRILGANGEQWVESQITDLQDVPEVGGVVVNFRDVSERRELELRLAHQAFHDTLTALPNRALFADRIEHALELQHADETATAVVLFIDLDDFKVVNDALGHVIGDEVLVEAARRISSCVRPGDTCARLGGDEFGVLLEHMGADAYEIGTRLLEALQAEVVTSEGPVSLDASIGLAFSRPGDSADDLIRNADLAMYQAKARGKGCLEAFEDGMREAVLERLALKLDMRRALDAGEFVPHYQPIISLVSGRPVGAEALVRWVHPERGMLSPATFIDIAEESGIIVEIGRQILAQACADAAGWPHHIGISVNLSPRQLQHDGLIDDVAEVLDATGLAPSRLTLEITETVLVADPVAAARVLGALKALGVSVALDDFGTGYSSLSYLNRFPVDTLKIDKSFVDAIGGGHGNDKVLLQAIVGLGRTLELTVVAEGIERPEQRASLQALGCALGQGYLFAHPMAREHFVELFLSTVGSSTA